MKSLLAFHNDAAIKEKYLARIRAHAAADEIVKGKYWESGKGCAVGCTVHSSDHAAYEVELGIPRVLARLEDQMFERLPNDLAMTWPERFLSAIPVGADLGSVADRFLLWILSDSAHGTLRLCNPKVAASTERIIEMIKRRIADDNPPRDDWYSARRAAYAAADADAAAAAAAYAAADADAYAAAAAAAAAYAYAAADAAAYAAADAAAAAYAYAAAAAAAYAAADAYADAYAARGRHYVLMSDKLIEILTATVPA